jgi:hypothetical protein
MADDIVFADGMICKKPHQNAPDFVKATVSFKMKEFVEWGRLHHNEGWVNVQIKESRGGKLYASLDTFTPSKQEEYATGGQQARDAMAGMAPTAAGGFEDDIPFSNYEYRTFA